jgi:Fur family ferric uptake transcriptional regulator
MFGDNRAVFELDSGVHHDHMICTECGRVEEFHNEEIERLQIELSKSAGFQLRYHEMNLYGCCAQCSAEKS